MSAFCPGMPIYDTLQPGCRPPPPPPAPHRGGGPEALAADPAQSAAEHPQRPRRDQPFVGANCQPIDRSPEQIRQDIAAMQAAGFSMVPMGGLSWHCFEPEEGHFTFDGFDVVVAPMPAAGIKVVVDIPGEPVPIWLHKAYPGADLVNQDHLRLHAATRHWDNTAADPGCRRLAATMLQRCTNNPAGIALGNGNAIGNGQLSCTEADRHPFIA
jgi:beta-galactosidase